MGSEDRWRRDRKNLSRGRRKIQTTQCEHAVVLCNTMVEKLLIVSLLLHLLLFRSSQNDGFGVRFVVWRRIVGHCVQAVFGRVKDWCQCQVNLETVSMPMQSASAMFTARCNTSLKDYVTMDIWKTSRWLQSAFVGYCNRRQRQPSAASFCQP